MIIFGAQYYLRIVGLPVLRCGAAPETGTAAPHEGRHRLQDFLRVSVLWVVLAIVFRYLAGDRFHLLSDRAGCACWRVFRQPHVNVGKVLQVFGEELRL